MVIHKIKRCLWFLLFSTAILFSFFDCELPQYYNDFDSRFSYHDTFHFLNSEDRAPALSDSYSFIVLSDTHIANAADADEFAALKNHIGDAKFIVVTGDITDHGTSEEIQLFIDRARTFGIPCYPVIGNHEVYTDRAKAWKELIGSTCYRIDSPDSNTTLFILDNANSSFGHDQIEWFEKEIKSAKEYTFVFTHDNFFIENGLSDFEQTTDINERARIMSVLKGRCKILFMGHLHKRIIKEAGGVKYIMVENYGSGEGNRTICRVHVSREGIRYEFEKI